MTPEAAPVWPSAWSTTADAPYRAATAHWSRTTAAWPRRTSYVLRAGSQETLAVKLEGVGPSWLGRVAQRIGELLRLGSSWDSYGALPISPAEAATALEILLRTADSRTPEPQIVPTSEGGLQLEWHERGIDIEVAPRADRRVGVYYADHRTGKEWEAELRADLTLLRSALSELAQRE